MLLHVSHVTQSTKRPSFLPFVVVWGLALCAKATFPVILRLGPVHVFFAILANRAQSLATAQFHSLKLKRSYWTMMNSLPAWKNTEFGWYPRLIISQVSLERSWMSRGIPKILWCWKNLPEETITRRLSGCCVVCFRFDFGGFERIPAPNVRQTHDTCHGHWRRVERNWWKLLIKKEKLLDSKLLFSSLLLSSPISIHFWEKACGKTTIHNFCCLHPERR